MEFLKGFYDFEAAKNGKVTGRCKYCSGKYTDTVGSSGNFHKHLKRRHKKEYMQSRACEPIVSEDEEQENMDYESTTYDAKINESIATNLIVGCNMPPSMLEHRGFRRFMNVMAHKWKPCSARYIKAQVIPCLHTTVKGKIQAMLNEIEHLSVTSDIWCDRRGKAFLGITGHFIDVDFKVHAVLLKFIRLKGRHTSENIRNVTKDILEELGISRKIYRIITDNASNMIKAYDFGIMVNDESDSENQSQPVPLSQPLSQSSESSKSYTEQNSIDEFDTESEWTFLDPIDDLADRSEGSEETNVRLSCFAHSLQLAIRDGLNKIPYLSKTFSKCKNLSKKSQKSSKVADLLEDVEKRINRSNKTRWSSEYLLIQSILRLGKKIVQDISNALGDDTLSFNNTDFSVLEEAVVVLEPFAEITSVCQSETAATVSMVLPAIVHILSHLKQMKSKVSLLKKLITQLEESINIRFAGIVKRLSLQPVLDNDPFNDPLYFVAALLDPKFKFRWLYLMEYTVSKESKIKHAMINLVLDQCERTRNQQVGQTSSQHLSLNSTENIAEPDINVKKRKLFQYEENERPVSSDKELTPTDELTAYLNDESRINSISFWKTRPPSLLVNVVKQVFSVQATSAPVERVFSQSGIVMSPKRTSMSDELFQSLVFLRVNQDI